MKKAIWTLFVTLTLIWTGFAFLAAGLARWTSDAIASDRLAETTRYVALTTERVTQKLTDATGRATEQVTATVTKAVGEEQQPNDGSTGATTAPATPSASVPILPPLPPLPPLPEWVNQWLAPEMVQSIEDWAVWAKSAANVGKAAVADAANASASAVPEVATQSTTMTGDAAAKASKAADAPWLADVVGWLVPIVWVIWGIGLILGLLLTLIAQWGASRFIAAHP